MTNDDWLALLGLAASLFLLFDVRHALRSGQSGGIIYLPNFDRRSQKNEFWFVVGFKVAVGLFLVGSSAFHGLRLLQP